MGKASRQKGMKRGGAEPSSTQKIVRSYISRVGYRKYTDVQFWNNAETIGGHQFANDLRSAMTEHIREPSAALVELMYRDMRTTQLTYGRVSPMLEATLIDWYDNELPQGDVLDLGCGPGLGACFYALMRPESQVVGVEVIESGVARARELAAALDLSNVSFLVGDVASIELSRRFAIVSSTAVFGETAKFENDVGFSEIRAARQALDSSRSSLADAASRHLHQDGVFVSSERLPNFTAFARWIGAQQAASLNVNLQEGRSISFKDIEGDWSRIPRTMGRFDSQPATLSDLLDWWLTAVKRPHGYGLTVERRLAVRHLVFVEGLHADVQDLQGEGQTRWYLVHDESSALILLTSSRGYREVLVEAPVEDMNVLREVMNTLEESIREKDDVVAVSALSRNQLIDAIVELE